MGGAGVLLRQDNSGVLSHEPAGTPVAERRQTLFDLLRLRLRSDEPEQSVIGLCRVAGYADRWDGSVGGCGCRDETVGITGVIVSCLLRLDGENKPPDRRKIVDVSEQQRRPGPAPRA